MAHTAKEIPADPLQRSSMSNKSFDRFSRFIYETVGIKLPPAKKTMVEARLQKRLRMLKMPNHDAYLEYLFSPQGQQEELVLLIDVVTTNTTDFFREPQHFSYLSQTLLPAWHAKHNRARHLKLWSAGCSQGMEPYTLAMVLAEFTEANPGFDYSILATDISTQVLKLAVNAVYDEDRVQPVPPRMKSKFLLRSKDRSKHLVRVSQELRRKVDFQRLNFMDNFSFERPMDIIFCRNVVIYFDKPTQFALFSKFCANLAKGGHLFIGHSESLSGMELPLKQIIPTVYVRL